MNFAYLYWIYFLCQFCCVVVLHVNFSAVNNNKQNVHMKLNHIIGNLKIYFLISFKNNWPTFKIVYFLLTNTFFFYLISYGNHDNLNQIGVEIFRSYYSYSTVVWKTDSSRSRTGNLWSKSQLFYTSTDTYYIFVQKALLQFYHSHRPDNKFLNRCGNIIIIFFFFFLRL